MMKYIYMVTIALVAFWGTVFLMCAAHTAIVGSVLALVMLILSTMSFFTECQTEHWFKSWEKQHSSMIDLSFKRG